MNWALKIHIKLDIICRSTKNQSLLTYLNWQICFSLHFNFFTIKQDWLWSVSRYHKANNKLCNANRGGRAFALVLLKGIKGSVKRCCAGEGGVKHILKAVM
jgi:hypothetical protein